MKTEYIIKITANGKPGFVKNGLHYRFTTEYPDAMKFNHFLLAKMAAIECNGSVIENYGLENEKVVYNYEDDDFTEYHEE